MPNPFVKSRVVFKRGGTTLYDLSNVATEFDLHMTLNDIDIFNFTVPTQHGASRRRFLDLQLFDDVLLYIGQTAIPADPLVAGKVVKITSQADKTVQRTFFCKDYMEVADRLFKTKMYAGDVDVQQNIIELATDLGWDTAGIAAEANLMVENFDGISYLELLKRLSDYWVSGSTCVRKDFKVDANKVLYWVNRPMSSNLTPPRTVETLTFGQGLMQPVVHWDVETIKNAIRVYGNQSRTEPDGATVGGGGSFDLWCESATGWTKDSPGGTGPYLHTSDFKVGTGSIYCDTDTLSPPHLLFHLAPTITNPIYCGSRKDGFKSLHLWIRDVSNIPGYVYAWAYFTHGGGVCMQLNHLAPIYGNWAELSLPIGPGAGWQTGIFGSTADDEIWNDSVYEVGFEDYQIAGTGFFALHVDGLYFSGGRFKSPESTDPTSITAYGRRESVTVDDKLLSDAECLNRQNSLLYMYKDPIPTVTCPVPLNLNLMPGDRLSLTLPHEGITAGDFDLTSVRHIINRAAATSSISGVGTVNTRFKPPMNAVEAIAQRFERQDLINRGVLQR